MILLDYSAVAFASVREELDADLIRQSILNKIRAYNLKYRAKYGKMVLCIDSSSWRKKVFKYYKAKRKTTRDDSSKDWKKIFGIINSITDDIRGNVPWLVVGAPGAEADDVIGVLVELTQEFGKHEEIMIVSGDKDFPQLQKYGNVAQYSPITKKLMKCKDPAEFIVEHTIRGDKIDGIPNILSKDDAIVTGTRQSSITKGKLEYWLENKDKLEEVLSEEEWRNYCRNRRLINLDYIPDDIKEAITSAYENAKPAHRSKLLNYLIKKRSRRLVECIGDFY